MQQPERYSLERIPDIASSLVKVKPNSPPELRAPWVVWEYNACIFTDGLEFTTADLHDAIKAHCINQNLPVNVLYAPDAYWVIEGAWGRAKVDDDRRPRVSLSLKGSRHTDMNFITGIDSFGDCWANLQMMILVQPDELERPPKPIIPKPLLPNEALVVLAVVALLLIFSGNFGLQILGILGLLGGLIIWAISNNNVRKAKEALEKWEKQIRDILLEEEEIKRNRLSRSFQYDDLFTFHEVMTKITSAVVHYRLLQKGAKLEGTSEKVREKSVIGESKKDMFDDF
jgi:hypothetical protein